MSEKRCMARFIPQAWVGDYAIDIDGAKDFDITSAVEAMGKEASLKLADDDYSTDSLAIEAGMLGEHCGPFRVLAEEAIRNYWEDSQKD